MAKKEMPESTVGLVHYEDFYFGDRDEDLLHLDCGKTLRGVTIRYETYGNLNADKSNAILIEHALTGDAHLAGKYSLEDKKPGWSPRLSATIDRNALLSRGELLPSRVRMKGGWLNLYTEENGRTNLDMLVRSLCSRGQHPVLGAGPLHDRLQR